MNKLSIYKEDLISVVIPTYNRYDLLKKTVTKVKEQTYRNVQIIISDDSSTDNTENIKNDFPDIEYIKLPYNMGYTQNANFALQHAVGDYVIFLTDDDYLEDNTFFEEAIKTFQNEKDVDLVFSRMKIRFKNQEVIYKCNFKPYYTPYSFFKWFKEVKTNFSDYICLSAMIFRKKILQMINPFESIFKDSSTIDLSLIIKYILFSRKIKFIDIFGYSWTFPITDTLSNKDRGDLVKQSQYNLAVVFDINNFIKKHKNTLDKKLIDLVKEILNLRVEWTFYAILSEKERLNNQKNFKKLLKKIKNKENIYIYGRGWTGLELKEFLEKEGVNIKYFIDDYKKDFSDTIDFNQFKEIEEHKTVILSMYKFKDLYNIYKKLNTLKNIEIFDLVS